MSAARTLRPFLAREWPALVGAAVSTIVLTLTDLASPWPIKLAIDRIVGGHEGAFTLDRGELVLLGIVGGLVVAIALVEALAQYVADYLMQSAGERITHEIRIAVYAHLQRLSLGFHHRRQKGDLVTRVTGDANAVGDLFSESLGEIVQSGLLLVGMVAVSLYLDPLLAAVSLATAPLLGVTSFAFRRRLRSAARRQRAQEGEIASLANEALSAMPVVKAFGSEEFEGARVHERSVQRMRLGIEISRLQARFDGLIGVLNAIGIATVLVVGVVRVAAGAITVGDLVVFTTYARKVNGPLRRVAREWGKVARSMARADRIGEILGADELLEDRPGAYRGPRSRGEVALDRVSFAYGPDRGVVENVTLELPAGAHVALIGPSGAGKSTLAALVARFHDPDRGRVLVDGRDVRDCSLAWYREQVGVLLQDTVLFSGTVAENIAYGSEHASFADVVAAAKAADAHDFLESLPNGYHTLLGPNGVGLSGGQRQRVGIARTLLRNPPVLVLDEPTTGLDRESEERVVGALERLMEGRTTILVTHSMALARRADRVIEVRDGRIVRSGRPDEVLPAPAARAAARPLPAADPGFPALARLLDPTAVAEALAGELPAGAGPAEVTVARVRLKPGRRAVVHYEVLVRGERHDLVATASGRSDLRPSAGAHAELARALADRVPGRRALWYASPLSALLAWLPADPALPALAEPPERLAERLRGAGVELPEEPGEPRLIGYKPGARAVLVFDEHVLKAYGRAGQFERARAGLVAAAAAGLATPRFEAALPDLRLTAQEFVRGRSPGIAEEAAQRAGALARELAACTPPGLDPAGPERELEAAVRRAELVASVLPAVRPALDTILARLRRTVPQGLEYVTAHGDLHPDQLLEADGRVLLLDLDDMCLAPAALDPATYAADAIRGRDGDLEAVEEALGGFLEGYGERPAGLEWYLTAVALARAAHPFNYQLAGWPERTEAMVLAADGLCRLPTLR